MKKILGLVGMMFFVLPTLSFAQEVTSTTSIETLTVTPVATAAPITTTSAPVVVETVNVIPGVVLEVTAVPPVAPQPVVSTAATNAAPAAPAKEEQFENDLLELIYTGFEEFVFKVFGW